MPRRQLIGVDLGGQKVTNLGAPTSNGDAATKLYVDTNAGEGGGGPAFSRTEFGDSDYQAVATDTYVAQTGTMSAQRIVTLPPAGDVDAGWTIRVADESGTLDGTNQLVVLITVPDTLVNGYLGALIGMTDPYQYVDFVSDGVDSWVWFDSYTTAKAYTDSMFPSGPAVDLEEGAGIQFVTAGGVTTISNRNRGVLARRTADAVITNNNTVPVADPVLVVPVEAYTDYRLDMMIGYNVAVLADMKIGFAVPAATIYAFDATNPITRQWTTETLPVGTPGVLPVLGTGTTVATTVTGRVRTGGASGTFGLKVAQNTANPSDVTILNGSVIALSRFDP